MPISIKSAREIELMTEAGRILAIVHEEMEKALRPGMTTKDIDRLGEEVIRSYGCVPSFLNYNGYPASVCVSVNDEVVHGIPTDKRVIREGDVVSLDAGVIYKGYHSDAARTHAVGAISPEAAKLIRVTEESFFEGMKYAKEGNYWETMCAGAVTFRRALGGPPAWLCCGGPEAAGVTVWLQTHIRLASAADPICKRLTRESGFRREVRPQNTLSTGSLLAL